MKTKICLCYLLLSQSVPASLIDFNNIPIGTEVSSLNPFGNAVISTRLWVTEYNPGQPPVTVAESFTRGVIGPFAEHAVSSGNTGSPSVVITAGPGDRTDWEKKQSWAVEISVAFQTPVSAFSVDAYSAFYNSNLVYTGVDAIGETFIGSAPLPSGVVAPGFTHFGITAPTGGYITGFRFSQGEFTGGIQLAMDNLGYTVPESIGLPTFAFAICGVIFLHRRIAAIRRNQPAKSVDFS